MNDLRKNLSFRAANIRHYLPDVLANAKEFTSWADVVEPELNAMNLCLGLSRMWMHHLKIDEMKFF